MPPKLQPHDPLEKVRLRLILPRPIQTVNGAKSPDEEDTINDDNLTPPPDTMSPVSSIPSGPHVNEGEDEIVVGVTAQAKSSPLRVTSDREDHEMTDVNQSLPIVSHYPKRKRASVYNDLSEDRIETSFGGDSPVPTPKTVGRPKTNHGIGAVKGVVLGYWRESEAPDEKDKHQVIGFIDIRDRLRTRVQPNNRDDEDISKRYPLPPGPGGSWVTFDKVVFDQHLVNLDHNQVKEYVKIVSENPIPREPREEALVLQKAAVVEAIDRVKKNPPPETATGPQIAYGRDIPPHALEAQHTVKKRRTAGHAAAAITDTSDRTNAVPIPVFDSLPGTRPTKILLGYWAKSDQELPDKHAVFGILGANDMFRVKVTKETRDGRSVEGNFPTGAGALWIQYEDVVFEPHLKDLGRPEHKEYVRVRQRQIDDGERPEEKTENETKAVYEAQIRAAALASHKSDPKERLSFPANGININGATDPVYESPPSTAVLPKREGPGPELRHSRRADTIAANRGGRHSLPNGAELRAANRTSSVDPLERTNSIAQREIARAEAAQERADQRAANRSSSVSLNSNKTQFQQNVSRLNKVWAAQEANRLAAGTEDAKIYMGIKYERKATGPFQGKLVSQGTIISIDGEDYVEYRVLTKPSFF
ncbi:hypothetical protein UCRPA7_5137 [Phaeoacremonium minimum UCRPA7]|uniref:Uncharacterized protein n=1 Tax=Phaeoacremonium minimum (strain UCR-PA7) TaxID=1286976 RepID=R8BJ64_PHAM7|nr:hypothetical protein UCRPA7_5137 [Phaeoacremonium minimum UCRPA7]EON99356.1 hypothetical protein UCRPA7_5137 [Phaeoacremonium minimum UCRPA7]